MRHRYVYATFPRAYSKSFLSMRSIIWLNKLNPYPYMKLADYIILTSDYEGFPLIYTEAIVLNKKIITTIDVSDDEISIPNRFGYIVSKEEKIMIKQIKEIIANDDLKLEKLDFNKLNKNRIEKIEDIFNEVI